MLHLRIAWLTILGLFRRKSQSAKHASRRIRIDHHKSGSVCNIDVSSIDPELVDLVYDTIVHSWPAGARSSETSSHDIVQDKTKTAFQAVDEETEALAKLRKAEPHV